MIHINELTLFFAWCTVINLVFYLTSVFVIIVFKSFIMSLHSKMIGVEVSQLPNSYFNFLGNYKIGILLLNVTPYIALKLMAS